MNYTLNRRFIQRKENKMTATEEMKLKRAKFLEEWEFRMGAPLTEQMRNSLIIAFNEGWLCAATHITPLAEKALKLAGERHGL
jgi:hypothetical protein